MEGPGEHPLVKVEDFSTVDELVVYLMHKFAYEFARGRIASGRVLDVGCNIGYGLLHLHPVSSYLAGVDVSPTAIAEARRRTAGLGIDVHLLESDRLPFANDSFDYVTSFQVIEHVESVPDYLREIARVLRPSGQAFFTTPNRLIRLDPGMAPWNPHHLREFSPDDLRDSVSEIMTVETVMGMFATPEIEAAERARLDRAKEDARRRDAGGFRQTLKRVLPEPVVSAIRGARRTLAGKPAAGDDPLPEFTTADFRYETEGLDDALDLMVVARAH